MKKEEALKNYIYNTCLSWDLDADDDNYVYALGEQDAGTYVTDLIEKGNTIEDIEEIFKNSIFLKQFSEFDEGFINTVDRTKTLIYEMNNEDFFEKWREEIKEN